MKPLVIGFFTVNTPYEHEAETLKLSLQPHKYDHDIVGVPNLGSWQKNTQYKARFVMDMLNKHPSRSLLYLDVDCIMIQPPLVLDDLNGSVDIAACHFADSNELMSGTVWFSNSGLCRHVVEKWIEFNRLYPDVLPDKRTPAWDQRTLEMAIKSTPGTRFLELPQAYTYVTELTQKRFPNLVPVILHTRGAYRFKKVINGKGNYGD